MRKINPINKKIKFKIKKSLGKTETKPRNIRAIKTQKKIENDHYLKKKKEIKNFSQKRTLNMM